MPELLIVGGLTVDHFADGRSAAGGSVLHAGVAAAAEGADLTVLTVAGDEPEAREGLARLATLGTVVRQPSAATTTYRHEEADGHRVLTLEAAADPIDLDAIGELTADVLLVAPIANEVLTDAVGRLRRKTGALLTVLLIQGWLRRLRVGAAATPMRLDEVSEARWREMGSAGAVVASTEDFRGAPADPFAAVAMLRDRLGAGPILVLTMATDGYLLDDPTADRIVASLPRRVVTGVPMVGAGDTFGATLALHLARGADPLHAADAASDRVIATLESRR